MMGVQKDVLGKLSVFVSEEDADFFNNTCDELASRLGSNTERFFSVFASALQDSYNQGWVDAGGEL